MPEYNWSVIGDTIHVSVDPLENYTLKKWEAVNEKERDFRSYKIGESWTSEDIELSEDGNYSIVIGKPENGYKAGFVELVFNPNSSFPLGFSSGTLVVPHTYPFPKFVSPNPKGTR